MPKTRTSVAAAAVAGLALRAAADVNTQVEWQVLDAEGSWGTSVRAHPGRFVVVRAILTYTGGAQPLGLASLVFQPTVSNWDASGPAVDTLAPFVNGGMGSNTSTPPGVVTDPTDLTQFGRMSPWGRAALSSTSYLRGHIHTNGSGGAPPGSWLRMARAQVTSWIGGQANTTGGSGVPISQLNNNSGPGGLYIFRFGITLSADNAARVLTVDAPTAGFGNRNSATGEREVYWWGSPIEAVGSIRGAALVIPATIEVVPCGSANFDCDGDSG